MTPVKVKLTNRPWPLFNKSARYAALTSSARRLQAMKPEAMVDIFCSYCGNHLGQAKLKNIGGNDYYFCSKKHELAFLLTEST